MIRWNSPCARPNCQRPAVIHFNGQGYCSNECIEAARAEERTLRGEARLRMEQARDARGQISTALSCAVMALTVLCLCISSLDRPASKHWQGAKLRSSQGAKLIARGEGAAR